MSLIRNITENRNFSIAPFSLKQGNIMLLFIPAGESIKVCENNNIGFDVKQKPYWVKFTLEVMNSIVIRMINDNIVYLSPFFSFRHDSFTKKSLKQLSGWDIRLVNMFIARKIGGVQFFELNTAGLSLTSIKLMFRFLISELSDSNYKVTYLVIEPNSKLDRNTPIFIDENNVEDNFKRLYE